METKLLYINEQTGHAAVQQAAVILKNGGLVAIPTETVYGLAASAYDETAVRSIYRAKGRPSDNPLIVHIADMDMLPDIAKQISDAARLCMRRFWPGPFTAVLPKTDKIPSVVSGGLDTVAVRMPCDPVARAVIQAAGLPLAAPSANLSGSPSPTTADRVIQDLNGRVDAIVAAGDCTVGVESTVVSFVCDPPRLLRPGGITVEQLKEELPALVIDPAVLSKPEKNAPVASPGMKYKHYAPAADITMVTGDCRSFCRYCSENSAQFDRALCFDEDLPGLSLPATSMGGETDFEKQAELLFECLRRLDEQGAARVVAHAPQKTDVGLAVYNRLIRAAGFKVVELCESLD